MMMKRHCIPAAVVALLGVGCHSNAVIKSDPVAQARQRLAASPHDPDVYLDLVKLSIGNEDYLRAAQYLSLAERADVSPERAEELFRLGLRIAVKSKNYGDAIQRCQERLRQKEDLSLRRLLAALFEAHGDMREAERQHQLILQIHPSAVEHMVQVARFYERSTMPDKLAQARALYESYLAKAPQGSEAPQVRTALQINTHDLSTK